MSILIVDDHEPFCASLRSMLARAGLSDIAVAPDGDSALVTARSMQLDWAIVDIQLGDGMDGFELAALLAALPTPPKIVCISTRDQSDYGKRIDEAPIEGFLPKDQLSVHALGQLFDESWS